ncbi:MAG TPA: ribose-phosphate pyrophosphokinase-like domain-containing protein, partial [Terracidiphilus sp.]|nr:ribose-phosphate pyrophosphokinase-like domain-containing protein [Terracidiphilus sp.]
MNTSDTLALFAGNANLALAQDIARHLQTKLGDAEVTRFSDGECKVEVMENVRGRDVFIVQPTCANPQLGMSANDTLMELLVMIDAAVGASAHRVVAV